MMQLVCSLVAIVLGFISAILWFLSARIGFRRVAMLGTLGDGAIALQIDDGTIFELDLPKQGSLNAWAAVATAGATFLQAISVLASIV